MPDYTNPDFCLTMYLHYDNRIYSDLPRIEALGFLFEQWELWQNRWLKATDHLSVDLVNLL